MYMGRTSLTLDDIRQYNAAQGGRTYTLHENDCRYAGSEAAAGAGGVGCCGCLSAAVAFAAVTVVLARWHSAIGQGVGRTDSPSDALAYSSIAAASVWAGFQLLLLLHRTCRHYVNSLVQYATGVERSTQHLKRHYFRSRHADK
jgi:hypothetical protein